MTEANKHMNDDTELKEYRVHFAGSIRAVHSVSVMARDLDHATEQAELSALSCAQHPGQWFVELGGYTVENVEITDIEAEE